MSLRSILKNWFGPKSSGSGRDQAAPTAKSFQQSQQEEAAFDSRVRGIRTIPLDRIVGSVGRYNDFDARFRIRSHMPVERLAAIKQAYKAGKSLPPVKLYQIKNEYYVLDGNHRIAALKEIGRDDVRARIVEFIPSKKSMVNLIYREKAEFDDVTRLPAEIELTEPGQYRHLIRQVKVHREFLVAQTGQETPLQDAALDWYRTIYSPLVEIIKNGNLQSHFPGRSLGDLFVYISVYQWKRSDRKRSYGIGVNSLVPQNMEEFRAKMAILDKTDYPDMLREITVFVLMSVEARKEKRIMDKLMQLDEVIEVHSVHGSVDIVLKIVLKRNLVYSDAETIGDFVHTTIRQIPGVLSTQTLIPGFSHVKDHHRTADAEK
jgi:DNA-binding Lrp family transcriptional regulator/uncharacterized ParB-like nuclease family protein